MKKAKFLESECERFFNVVTELDFTEDKQIKKFLTWAFSNGFFNNVSQEDFDYFYADAKEGGLCLPLMVNNGICIGIEYWKFDDGDAYCRVGIDPTYCFNKISQCSICMKLPITSKREQKQFYKRLEQIMDNKSTVRKNWLKGANTFWYGEYMSNEK